LDLEIELLNPASGLASLARAATVRAMCANAQTVISALTLIALVWYAWETRKIRLDAAKQNALIAEQVALSQRLLKLENEREVSSNEPMFQWEGAGTGVNLDEWKGNFRNTGAAVTQLSASYEDGSKMDISPSSGLSAGQAGSITISPAGKAVGLRFRIEYTTQRNERRAQYFITNQAANPTKISGFSA
jgi:hypothetical protein